MSTEIDLTDMINQIVSEKTFSLDALNAIQSIKTKAVELEKELKRATEWGKQMERERGNLQSALSRSDAEVVSWKNREAELVKREAAMTGLEKSAAVEAAKSATWKEACTLVFRNTTIREHVVGNHGASMPNGGYSNTMENKTVTREQD